eukprot:TRINITY_DN3620_c0_g1_i4.p1 TRINITY_DN3620_c0_g1~~TRINITY_DN3620_c0_g1_i4.p1  ORF type:complete len:284 (-),score=87.97 TRINITY_DN3620_c0_g1_i4:327-1178(-)
MLRKKFKVLDEDEDGFVRQEAKSHNGASSASGGRTSRIGKISVNKKYIAVMLMFLIIIVFAVTVLCVFASRKPSRQNYWKASQITPNVWLGGYKDQLNKNKLKEHNITHILMVAIEVEPAHPKDFEYLVIRAHDFPDQDLISYFPQAHAFISEAVKQNSSILVHCMAGVSRSATMVISWLMDQRDLGVFEATEIVRKGRDRIKPNREFRLQLELYNKLDRVFNETLYGATRRWDNKAQVSRYHLANQTIEYFAQPHWVVEDPSKELLHAFYHFYLRLWYSYFK